MSGLPVSIATIQAEATDSDKRELKRQIARQFGKAAASYDVYAQVQQQIADFACQQLQPQYQVLADLGCGSGRVTRSLTAKAAQLIGVDLAEGMVSFAAKQCQSDSEQQIFWLAGDAEQLPLADASVDGMVSSMALQWCPNPQLMLAEVARVLAPGGHGVLAILADDALYQLGQSWQAVDNHSHMNQFHPSRNWLTWAKATGLRATAQQQEFISWHPHIRHLLASIRAIGANTVTEAQAKQPLTRESLKLLERTYSQRFGTEQGLPLSYKVCVLELHKPKAHIKPRLNLIGE